MRFSRQEYWSGLPCPPPGDLSNPGIKSAFLTSPALAGGFFTTSATWEAPTFVIYASYYEQQEIFENEKGLCCHFGGVRESVSILQPVFNRGELS